MMCYKDRTFCNIINCDNKECKANFTKEERDNAIRWWGDENYPLSIADFKSENCGFIPNLKKGNK